MNELQGLSLESLGSWHDLMKTMTRADFVSEISIQEESNQYNEIMLHNNQLQQDLLQGNHRDREMDLKDQIYSSAENSIVSENSVKEEKKERLRATDKRSLSLDRKKHGRKNLGAMSLHNLSRNDDIREESENNRDLRKKSTLDVASLTRGKIDKGSRTSLQMGSINLGQKDRLEYKKSIVNLGFVDKRESSPNNSGERENEDTELNNDLKKNNIVQQEEIQGLINQTEENDGTNDNSPKDDFVKDIKEIKESYVMELGKSRSVPNIPVADEKDAFNSIVFSTEIIQEADASVKNAVPSQNLDFEKTVIAHVPLTIAPEAEPYEPTM